MDDALPKDDRPRSDLTAAVLEQAPVAIIATDASGTIRHWNRCAADLFGFSADEVVGGGLDVIIPQHLRAAHWRGFRAAIETGKAKSGGTAVRTRATHKNGSKLYVELSFAVLTDSAGSAIGALALARPARQEQ